MKPGRNGVSGRPIDRRHFLQCIEAMGAMASLGRRVSGRNLTHSISADSRLPDGTVYAAWDQPLTFSKTYYVDKGDAKADDNSPGTKTPAFRTINRAAELLQPGERVVIASGVYRECVRPARGGTSPSQMISYEAAPGAQVVIKGSEVLKDGWVEHAIPTGGPGAQGAPLPAW